jgi:predicted enzyme related to lactoylglutathione lyase
MDTPTIGAIGQIAFYVQDLPASIAFYRDQVGVPFLFEAPPAMAFFRAGDTRILIGAAPPGRPVHPPSALQFRVADIHAAHRALAARGVTFVNEPHVVHRAPGYELWLAEFAGPEGAAHALMEERGALPA